MNKLPSPTLISVDRPSALLLVAQLGGWDIQSATSTAVVAVVSDLSRAHAALQLVWMMDDVEHTEVDR